MPDEAVQGADYVALAEATAQALGVDFVIGARPYDKGWFAHCAGITFDGGTPDIAVRQVVEALHRKTRNELNEARVAPESASKRLTELAALIVMGLHEMKRIVECTCGWTTSIESTFERHLAEHSDGVDG